MQSRVLTAICVLLATFTVAQSRRWFAPEVNCWITQKKVPASWEDAQRRCERHGAVLASPLNIQLYGYMQTLITVHNHSEAYFIGIRANRTDNDEEVRYVSVEGRQLDDMPRAMYDAIEQLDLEQGDCLSMDRHGIRAVSCWDHLPYICYSNESMECGSVPATTPSPTTSVPTTTSTPPPPGYTFKSATGSFYKLHNEIMTWFVANAICLSEGAHLVVLNNVVEADIVLGTVMEVTSYDGIWIGLRDYRPEGVMDWRTVHGDPVGEMYHEWRSNRPYNKAGYTCGVFSTAYHDLVDWDCSDKRFRAVCEISP